MMRHVPYRAGKSSIVDYIASLSARRVWAHRWNWSRPMPSEFSVERAGRRQTAEQLLFYASPSILFEKTPEIEGRL